MIEPKLLVRMPTRQRPSQAVAALTRYRKMAETKVAIEVVIDEDDATMQTPGVLAALDDLECIVTVGKHTSKIEAVNGGSFDDWEILLLASDDMLPVVQGYDLRVFKGMKESFPYLDGAIYFKDGYADERCCTLPVVSRRFYDQFGYVYHKDYRSLWSDQEQTELWKALGRLKFLDEMIIEHRHPVRKLADNDALYTRNDAFWSADKATYERRKATMQPHAEFGFDSPPLWLSILICTMEKRAPMLNRLLDNLYGQLKELPRVAEIIVDGGSGSIGEKRQRLLEAAKGKFVAFIDDDDEVVEDYVQRVVGALSSTPDADCARLMGIITTNGSNQMRFEHSLKYFKWGTDMSQGLYFRCPNHLSAVKREHALKTGFLPISHGEDSDYSMRLYPLLKKEADTGSDPLYRYLYVTSK